ncbi:chemotaxis protein CheY [Dehalococcoides mccartyi]|uniref:HD domain-containing phosphohydrolase n=1 Tax=Dehalococcoides mccartyi TaxID=61435 RepID=UPI0002B76C46|nr:HD domain-containing phosphohydrolase [Dehalococcoides mccartyi]AGG07689.1 response regulator receiver modulated metal-dependent phosphohydrolase [Dehalococcoides mccartyi BTF08]KSV16891.1 chemotaxis protein CheY [Dehalococcoides mccartyi]
MITKSETVLTVDDEDTIRRLLYQKITSEGYKCLTASNATEAMEIVKNHDIALAILDIKMPGLSGMDILPEIRIVSPDTAVIMATAISDTDTAINCMKLGAYDYVTKPFKLDAVIMGIERALEKRRLILENRDYQEHLELKIKDQAEKIRSSFFNAITSLAYALEAKDSYTIGHSQRVAETSVAIAGAMELPFATVEQIRLAGLVHDIGKIGIRSACLNKAGNLTEEEYNHIKTHPSVGERILSPITEDHEILKIVRHHHEHFNGRGYPDGLKGEEIPLGARIMALADAYDAMTSLRPYRKAMTDIEAWEELKRCSGIQFDPEIVAVFACMNNHT